MANRAAGRYDLPICLGTKNDATQWVAGAPYFFGNAVKYIWRGWDEADDLSKAADCLVKCARYEQPYIFKLATQASKKNPIFADQALIDMAVIENEHKNTLFEGIYDARLEVLSLLMGVFYEEGSTPQSMFDLLFSVRKKVLERRSECLRAAHPDDLL